MSGYRSYGVAFIAIMAALAGLSFGFNASRPRASAVPVPAPPSQPPPAANPVAPEPAESLQNVESPALSYDGRWIAYELVDADGRVTTEVASVKNGKLAAKTPVDILSPTGSPSDPMVIHHAFWHPAGLEILTAKPAAGPQRFYLYAPKGSSPTVLLDEVKSPGSLSDPHVSPGGNAMVFVQDVDGKTSLRTWLRGDDVHAALTDGSFGVAHPAYATDASGVYFDRFNEGDRDIYKVVFKSKRVTPIVTGAGDQTRVVVLPASLVYFAHRATGQWDVERTDLEGKQTKVVAADVQFPESTPPAISDDGHWLAWTSAITADQQSVFLTSLGTGDVLDIPTSHHGVGDVAIRTADGHTIVAYTYVEGSQPRQLALLDITDKLPPVAP